MTRVARFLSSLLVAVLALTACTAGRSGEGPALPVAELRRDGARSRDPEVVARWLLGELISPGGQAGQARKARAALDRLRGDGILANLARGLDDSLHGNLGGVPDHYLGAVRAARDSNDENAPLIAWFAAEQAISFHRGDDKLFQRWQPFLEAAIAEPRSMGWRARAELLDFWQNEVWSETKKDVQEEGARMHGCAEKVRVAGPFGSDAPLDTTRSFPAEAPGPWPERWAPEPGQGLAPEILEIEREGCHIGAKETPGSGVYYFETFLDLPTQRDVLISVQGAYAILVDDHLVSSRDLREWGSWTRFGVALQLVPGRHRILARVAGSATSIRILQRDGRALGLATSSDARRPYVLSAPRVLPNANALDPFLQNGRLRPPEDDVIRFLAAAMCHTESQADVANVLIEPLIERPEHATGPVLSTSALFTESDPIFSDSQRRDLVRELHERAAGRDPRLWHSRLNLALSRAERDGLPEAVNETRKLVDEFKDVPAVLSELAQLYRELDWDAEYSQTVLQLAERFPDTPSALEPAIAVHDAQGRPREADALVERIQRLNPDSEIALRRALDRQDYDTALSELKRLGERRPQRKDIVERTYDVMVRAGNQSETWKKLEAALAKDPKDQQARLDLADAAYARGKPDALVRALLDAVQAGAPTDRLEEALDLVEGVSELEPYRLQAEPIIEEYERSGKELPGTAARVLDYSTIWVHADGSSRMLEHEIVRVQSAEAISEMAEQPVRGGLMLHVRVIKKDGQILEPELVEGKPTLTMPHLEVGDYIETETIESYAGDGQRGSHYFGPRWYFREENIAYARSQFTLISPQSKPLQIETRNQVPAPEVNQDGALVIRRWRVDHSPAAPVEPFSAPIVEFLPSVQVGWGVSLERTLEAMSSSAVDVTPIDPRIARIARRIVQRVPASARAERAKVLYRWLVTNVENGEEADGRRVIVGRNGNLWRGYITLCKALGIEISYAVAQSRLTLPPTGPFSEATLFGLPLLRVSTEKGPIWLTLGSKYAPFGYVPADARGMPGYILSESGPRPITVPTDGIVDRVVYRGDIQLKPDGSAEVELVQTLHGKYGTGLRAALAEVPQQRLRDVIETRLVGQALHGAQLIKYSLLHLEEPDEPLEIRTRSRVPAFAQLSGNVLSITPPFAPRIGQLAALPARQTPLLLVETNHQLVELRLHLPPGASLAQAPLSEKIGDGGRQVLIQDRKDGDTVLLHRELVLPSGRVQPGAYPAFLRFARHADDAMSSSIRVRLGRGE